MRIQIEFTSFRFDPSQRRDCPEWMQIYAQAPNTFDFGEFTRVYFSSRLKPDENNQFISNAGFFDLSNDGKFTVLRVSQTPVLELGELGSFDEFGIYPFSVCKDMNSTSQLIAAYAGWSRASSVPFEVSIGIAKSNSSGESFLKLGQGPLLTKSLYEPFVISSPKIRQFNNLFYLFYIAGTEWSNDSKPDPTYSIRLATSPDGENWRKHGSELIEKVIQEGEAQASPDVFEFQGKYHMVFCYRNTSDFRGNQRGYRLGYAESDDLINWTRRDNELELKGKREEWNQQSISYPHVFFIKSNPFLLYLGNEVGRTGIGLARLNIFE